MADDRAAPMQPVATSQCVNELVQCVETHAPSGALIDRCLGYLHRRYFAYIAGAIGVLFAMLFITIVILVQQIRVLSAVRRR